jgi:CheY-like chemotaxis protein
VFVAVDDGEQPQVRELDLDGEPREVLVTAAGEALALLADNGHLQYQVLLTDIGMPGMDGYGLVSTLRQDLGVDAAALPAVAVTALARADDRRRALASGFQEHVAKPYSVAQLVGVVRRVQATRGDSLLH